MIVKNIHKCDYHQIQFIKICQKPQVSLLEKAKNLRYDAFKRKIHKYIKLNLIQRRIINKLFNTIQLNSIV